MNALCCSKNILKLWQVEYGIIYTIVNFSEHESFVRCIHLNFRWSLELMGGKVSARDWLETQVADL